MPEAKRPPRTRRNAKSKAQKTIAEMFGKSLPEVQLVEDDPPPVTRDVPPPDASSLATALVIDSAKEVPSEETELFTQDENLTPKTTKTKRLHPMFEKRARTSDSEQATSQVAETILHTTIDITDGCTEDEARSTNSKSPLLIISNSPSLLNPMSTAHGQSPDAPIIIDSPSHKYAPEIVATVSPARPSFSLTVRAAPSPSRPLRHHPLSQSAPGIPPALPDNQSLHVRGPQSTFPSGALPFPRRIRRVTESLSAYRKDIEATSPPFRIPSFSFACPTDILHEIPKTHRSYPALFRILKPYLFDDPKPPTFPLAQESWSERWKPQRAEEVLGNEEQAIYLRDWLAALRLQGITVQEPVRGKLPHNRKSKKRKRPDIIRQVKKRQKTGMEDFIASDGSDDESNYYDQQLDSELILASKLGCSSPSSHATSLASSPLSSPPATEPEDYELPAPQFTHGRTHLSSKLHNTILLCGPSGCGKTAAVYACAEELGWDVFEVFPGIGERNGPSLNKLVGDVGKNHLVKAVHQAHRFFGPQIGSQRMTESCHHPQLDGEDKPPNSPLPTTTRAARSMTPDQEVKQSLILVEEVDILYQTDTGFWNALINIIKECRRPVVLTCNDISLVPTEDLPLQDTLNFHPCPSDLATSYLQTLCLAEGFSVGRGALENLFGCVETQQGPLDSFTDRFPSSPRRFDLRHCITQLQFWLSGRTTTEPTSHRLDTMIQHLPSRQKLLRDSTDIRAAERSPEDNAETLRQFRVFARTLDTASFINAELARNASHPMNGVLMSDGNDFSVNDEELGYRVLRTQPSSSSDVSFTPFFHRDQVLADEALQLCWNLHTPEGGVLSSDMDMDERLLSERQSSYGIQMAPVFAWTRRVFSSKEHVPKYLEYLPWIRYMVGIDNAAQELLALTTSQTRRTTINSKKAQNPRLINLNATVLEALGNTTLVLCDSES